MVNKKKENNMVLCRYISGLFLLLIVYGCNNTEVLEKDTEVKKIFYSFKDSEVNQLVLDSILRSDFDKVTHCRFDYCGGNVDIIFFYEDDDFTPWTDEMILRTNRFLKIDSIEIPLTFESDLLWVVNDSILSQRGFLKSYNWFNNAVVKIDGNHNLIEYENYYAFLGGPEGVERMKKRFSESENTEE